MVLLAEILRFVAVVIAAWNLMLWWVPRGFPIYPGLTNEAARFGGADIRNQYRWANGVPILGSVCALAALAFGRFAPEFIVAAAVVLAIDPCGLAWELIRERRSRA